MYNVPSFEGDSPRQQLRNAIVYCYDPTKTNEAREGWLEVNELKWFFRPTQLWTREPANSLLLDAWHYGEFS